MSASNWRKCPRCSAAAEDTKKLYGTVPEDEYLRLRHLAAKKAAAETLREDYEIGIVNGEFRVSYGATCMSAAAPSEAGCGFEFSFEHKQAVQ